MDAWPLDHILRYLDTHGMRITVRGGQPHLTAPPGKLVQQYLVIPHMKARRDEILTHFGETLGASPKGRAGYSRTARDRSEVFVGLCRRAGSSGKHVWHLMPNGLPQATKGQPPDEANYACVEGDREWTKLPACPSEPSR